MEVLSNRRDMHSVIVDSRTGVLYIKSLGWRSGGYRFTVRLRNCIPEAALRATRHPDGSETDYINLYPTHFTLPLHPLIRTKDSLIA